MKIQDLKQPYKALALVRQKEQGRETNENIELIEDSKGSFNWFLTRECFMFWNDVNNGNYPPIPPDSLKDIPLQVRWDSGERFRFKTDSSALVTELHTFKIGRISVCYSDGEGGVFDTENRFFEYCEPIPSEPQTRWVNVYLANDAYCKHDSVTFDEKPNKAADISVQQQLINSKWVNV